MLTIVLLFSNLLSLLAQNDITNPSTGEITKNDTTVVISINLLRQANAKMIERLHFIDIVNVQDSIILDQQSYINTQKLIIKDFQNKVAESDKINKSLNDSIKRQKKTQRMIYTIGGVAIGGIIIGLILK